MSVWWTVCQSSPELIILSPRWVWVCVRNSDPETWGWVKHTLTQTHILQTYTHTHTLIPQGKEVHPCTSQDDPLATWLVTVVTKARAFVCLHITADRLPLENTDYWRWYMCCKNWDQLYSFYTLTFLHPSSFFILMPWTCTSSFLCVLAAILLQEGKWKISYSKDKDFEDLVLSARTTKGSLM